MSLKWSYERSYVFKSWVESSRLKVGNEFYKQGYNLTNVAGTRSDVNECFFFTGSSC